MGHDGRRGLTVGDGGSGVGDERGRVLSAAACGDPGAGRDGERALGPLPLQLEQDAGGDRRLALHAKQVEEGDVGLVRQPVEPVQHGLGQVGEDLDERHARVVGRQVGPLRACRRDARPGVVDELGEGPIIEVRQREGHGDGVRLGDERDGEGQHLGRLAGLDPVAQLDDELLGAGLGRLRRRWRGPRPAAPSGRSPAARSGWRVRRWWRRWVRTSACAAAIRRSGASPARRAEW